MPGVVGFVFVPLGICGLTLRDEELGPKLDEFPFGGPAGVPVLSLGRLDSLEVAERPVAFLHGGVRAFLGGGGGGL